MGVDEGADLGRQRLPVDRHVTLGEQFTRPLPGDVDAEDGAAGLGDHLHHALGVPDDHGPAIAGELGARATARMVALCTARTSMPSTRSPSMPYAAALDARAAEAVVSFRGVEEEYWVLSTTKQHGSCITPAQ